MSVGAKLRKVLRIRSEIARAFLAELLGTFVLICFGDGSVAQYIIGGSVLDTGFLAVNVAWGIGVTMGVYMSAGVSGGHINPAVTLTMAIMGKLSWIKVPVYFLAQYLGAFLGAAAVFGVYYDGITHLDGGTRLVNQTAGIFSTYPQGYVTVTTCFFDQVLGTALLLMCVMAITDDRNHGAPKGVVAIGVGLSVMGIGAAFGLNCGYAINPARDLGPRILTAIAGWGTEVFTVNNGSAAWVPVVGPHVGALVGACIYQLMVGLHNADDKNNDADEDEYDLYGMKDDQRPMEVTLSQHM